MEVFEIVFDNIPRQYVYDIIKDLLHQSYERVKQVGYIGDIEFDICNLTSLEQALELPEPIIITITTHSLLLGDATIDDAMILVAKYNGVYDVEVSVEVDDDDSDPMKTLANRLQPEVKKLAQIYHVSNYYAGMEPASDEKTRYFTGDIMGPL